MRSRMTLVPKLFSHWWEALERPHRLMDQHFGMALRPDELLRPSFFDRRFEQNYYRPWAELMRDTEKGWSMVKNENDKFHVALDVQQFKPEEIKVKIVDNFIIVEGKHEEMQDDHGIVSRQFMRKYMVPEQCDPEQATSTLSSDGVLTVTAPRKPEALENKRVKPIKIEHTGKPALENENEQQGQQQKKIASRQ